MGHQASKSDQKLQSGKGGQSPSFGDSQSPLARLRLILLLCMTTAVIIPHVYQPILDRIWLFLRSTKVYNWSSFETFWTVFCYAAIEPAITAVFIRHPEWRYTRLDEKNSGSSQRLKPRGMRRPSRRGWEALIYMMPLLLMDFTMIKKFADVPLEDMLRSGNYGHEADISDSSGRYRSTFLVPTLHNMTLSSPLQTKRALPTAAPSSRRLVLELIISLIIYDATFFLFHLLLHIIPPLRKLHAPHHSHDAQINPQVTNQLHIIERLGLVMLANFSLNIIKSHVLTRTLFVPLFVWLLIEIHSGMDLPWAYDKILPRGWAGGAKKHMEHHRTGQAGVEPFFNWCDAIWENATMMTSCQSKKFRYATQSAVGTQKHSGDSSDSTEVTGIAMN